MSHTFIHGQRLAKELVDALGITQPVRSIVIEAHCSHAASVTVEFVPTAEDADRITAIIKQYRLEELK